MDFVAIDFETANHRPDSACQVAAVSVKDSQIVDQRVWLIRPPSDYFSPLNISVHGIRLADVQNAPSMEVVWQELQSILEGQTVVAHNARFDVSVLVSSLAAHDIACSYFDFHCTCLLARATWPGRRRYGLKPLGNWLGIEFKHHDALEDARCCALIALAVEAASGPPAAWEHLENNLGMSRGFYKNQRITSPKRRSAAGQSNSSSRSLRSLQFYPSSKGVEPPGPAEGSRQYTDRWGFPLPGGTRPLGSVDFETIHQSCLDRPLDGKNIVMLGPLRGSSMVETVQLLTQLGATVQASISSTTHIVVATGTSITEARRMLVDPSQARSSPPNDTEPAVTTASMESAQPATGIRVLSERQFRALLPGGAISF